MRRIKRISCVILILIAGALAAFESRSADDKMLSDQQGLAAQTAIIRVQSNLVRVPVSITDAAGNAVPSLGINDFRIEENGRPETLARIAEPGETAIELALLLDVSGSVLPRFEFERQAATRFLQRVIRSSDRLTIFAIGPRPELIQEHTGDLGTAMRSLNTLFPTRGTTSFYDSVAAAARFLRKIPAPDSRRVQVVISDGEDNNSESYVLQDALLEVQRADCLFYSINPGGPSIRLNKVSTDGQMGMQLLATQTGGTAFVPEKLEDLDSIFNLIATELRAQYLLEYYSSDQHCDGSFRHIIVRTPNHPDLRIRARQGYYSARG